MRNLEFKARVDDLRKVDRKARELGAELWGDLRQTDTYFHVPTGHLKLRETPSFPGELIYYARDEDAAHRPSDYQITHASDVAALYAVLSAALGVLAVVRKRRTLLLLDSTRLHLDNVERLGSFLEIEVPVEAGEDEVHAKQRLDDLIRGFGFDWRDCIRASYLDLVLAGPHPNPVPEGEGIRSSEMNT
jgi:adenylate cyclase class IV